MTADDMAAAVGSAAAAEMSSALARIKHCLAQLSDDQIWHRSAPSLRSRCKFSSVAPISAANSTVL